jgi:hypothetical protein
MVEFHDSFKPQSATSTSQHEGSTPLCNHTSNCFLSVCVSRFDLFIMALNSHCYRELFLKNETASKRDLEEMLLQFGKDDPNFTDAELRIKAKQGTSSR